MQDNLFLTILLTSAKWSRLALVLSEKWMTLCLPAMLAIWSHRMAT